MKKLTLENFILKANVKHNCKYNYSKVIFSRTLDKIIIICQKHGEFFQGVSSHLQGEGCRKCSLEASKNTILAFITKSKKIFGDIFDYSLIKNYKNNKSGLPLICKICGTVFKTTYNRHIAKHRGCRTCSIKNRNERTKELRSKNFIDKAQRLHGNRYTYNNCNYVHSFKKVLVTCKKHGDFLVTPCNHIQLMNGCPRCRTSKGEILIESFLEEHNIVFEKQKTYNDLKSLKNYRLRYDFFIPSENLLIEFDGSQHTYKSSKYYTSDIEVNDKIKNDYAIKNKINLLRILANHRKNIDKILQKAIL